MIIITEKFSEAQKFISFFKAKEIEKGIYEADNVTIIFAQGHVYTLADADFYKPEYKKWNFRHLPIIPEHFKYIEIKEKTFILKPIKKVLKKAIKTGELIVIATDPDREGEVIARLILKKNGISEKTNTLKRFWITEAPDEKIVKEALSNLEAFDKYSSLALAGFTTKECDWLFGINMTRFYSLKLGSLYSVGRVQTATLYELFVRNQIRKLHLGKLYFELLFTTEEGSNAYLYNIENKNIQFDTENIIKDVLRIVKKGDSITIIEKTIDYTKEKCPSLYNLTELQKDASELYGYAPSKTLEIAQSLYSKEKVISYPRTQSKVLGTDNIELAKKIYKEIQKNDSYTYIECASFTKENTRLFNTDKIEGHHGLIPNSFYETTDIEKKAVYDLIKSRFMMQAEKPYVMEVCKTKGKVGDYSLVSENQVVIEKGWKNLCIKGEKEKKKGITEEVGEKVKILKCEMLSKKTKPLPLYTESTILGFMENPTKKEGGKLKGIGTAATRASILNVLYDREYIVKKGKSIEVTPKGEKIIEEIEQCEAVRECVKKETTTLWEEYVTEDPGKLQNLVKEVICKIVKENKSIMEQVKMKEVLLICPCCGNDIVEGEKNFYCSGYKDGCTVAVSKKIYSTEISKDYFSTFDEKGCGEVITGKDHDGERIVFRINLTKDGIHFTYLDNEMAEIGKCPLCKGQIKKYPNVYSCSKKSEGCTFFLWKETFGAIFTPSMIRALLKGGKINVECKKKDGEKYLCDFTLERNKLTRISKGV